MILTMNFVIRCTPTLLTCYLKKNTFIEVFDHADLSTEIRDTENWSNAIIGNVFLETVLNDKIIFKLVYIT